MNTNPKKILHRKIDANDNRNRAIGYGGFTLAEMVVAVGVSATFILMLASLLAQTLRVSSNLQDQLYAVAIAEVATENAKSTPFSILRSFAGKGKQELKVYVDNNPSVVPRLPPLQFDLNNTDTIFGAVNPQIGQVELTSKWTNQVGNFFRGRVEETITEITDKVGLECIQVDVDVYFTLNGAEAKRVSRSAIVFAHE